jgi:hypothetical protein
MHMTFPTTHFLHDPGQPPPEEVELVELVLDVLPDMHDPALHVALLMVQSAHAPPPVPHALSDSPPWHALVESQQPPQFMHAPPELVELVELVLDASSPPLVLLVDVLPLSSPPPVDEVLEYELLLPPDEPDDPVLEPKLLLVAPPPPSVNLPPGRVSPAAQALAAAAPVKARSKTTDPPERGMRLISLRLA